MEHRKSSVICSLLCKYLVLSAFLFKSISTDMNNGSHITDANFGVADVNLSSPSTNSTFKKMTSIVDISSMATSTTLKIQVSKNV